jgi:hypothetical protein
MVSVAANEALPGHRWPSVVVKSQRKAIITQSLLDVVHHLLLSIYSDKYT